MNTENSICAFCGWEKKDHRYGYCYHYSSESEDHFYTDKKFIATENSSHGYSEGSEVPESNKEGEEKPDYINKEVKNVSEADLKKALHEVKEKNERDSLEMKESINRALSDGFRCGPAKAHNAKRFESGEHAEIVIQSLRDQLAAKDREISNLKEALKAIANPIKHMQESLKDDEQLNGPYAITLANDPHYYRNIAEKALLTYNKIK